MLGGVGWLQARRQRANSVSVMSNKWENAGARPKYSGVSGFLAKVRDSGSALVGDKVKVRRDMPPADERGTYLEDRKEEVVATVPHLYHAYKSGTLESMTAYGMPGYKMHGTCALAFCSVSLTLRRRIDRAGCTHCAVPNPSQRLTDEITRVDFVHTIDNHEPPAFNLYTTSNNSLIYSYH